MRKILLSTIVLFVLVTCACKKKEGANPYDPNTPITVSAMPKISSFAPLEAETGGVVTIKGINFTGATGVFFGGKPAGSFTVTSDSTIAAVVGFGASGTVSVTNVKGTKALAGFNYIAPIPPVENGNLALNKPASASSSFNDPKFSVDGKSDTRWSTKAATNNEWYKVDLQALKKINRIFIQWEGAYASEYTIQVSKDDVAYTTVFTTSAGAGGDIDHVFAATEARYVKILLIKGALPYPMSFWEFEVYADPPPVNLALNKVATASSSFNNPGLAIDGEVGTRWSVAAAKDNEWYKVDLGKAVTVGRVDVKWEGAYASDYTIQISSDDVNYTSVFSTSTGAGGDVSHAFTPIEGRYVKILLNKGATPWPMSFWEFEVYSK